jgi:hypothetical protein
MNSTVAKAAMHRDSEVKVLAHDPGKKSCAPLKAMKRSHQAANPAGEYSHPHQIDAGLYRGYGSVLWRAPPGRAIHKVLHASEQEREDVVRARRRWIRNQGLLDSTHLVLKPLMPLQERSTETITSTGISTGQALLGKRMRQWLTVRGMVSSSRAIARVDLARRSSFGHRGRMRAHSTCRCSVVGARSWASSTARSSGLSRISLAAANISVLNHESASREAGATL